MQVLKDPPCSASHYYLRSLSWTSRTFYFPDSRDLREVLRDFLGREREREGGVPIGLRMMVSRALQVEWSRNSESCE